jgi:hypothetical protein
LRRSNLTCHSTVTRAKNAVDVAGMQRTPPHIDQRSDDRSHHLPTKSGSPDHHFNPAPRLRADNRVKGDV